MRQTDTIQRFGCRVDQALDMNDREMMKAAPQQHQDTAGPEIVAAHSRAAADMQTSASEYHWPLHGFWDLNCVAGHYVRKSWLPKQTDGEGAA